jgi:hypothetical protein
LRIKSRGNISVMSYEYKSLSLNAPVMFTDGTEVYNKLALNYRAHAKGYYILAPSGSGKTYFVTRQTVKDWVEGDELWLATHAHPNGPWWEEPLERRVELEARSDVITQEAKRLGFWIIGGSNTWLRPDALVMPSLRLQKRYILERETSQNDVGFSLDQEDRILAQRKWFLRWIKQGVPKFDSVDAATVYIASLVNGTS